ncbi:hypothetical protein HDU96_001307 [Phlyctochytrium bullatum]|nr:hypothetical protein HDU96_001307 [Phlyctochytrium bullatum]
MEETKAQREQVKKQLKQLQLILRTVDDVRGRVHSSPDKKAFHHGVKNVAKPFRDLERKLLMIVRECWGDSDIWSDAEKYCLSAELDQLRSQYLEEFAEKSLQDTNLKNKLASGIGGSAPAINDEQQMKRGKQDQQKAKGRRSTPKRRPPSRSQSPAPPIKDREDLLLSGKDVLADVSDDELLRYRLNQLGFQEAMPKEAIPLVLHLFQDLVMTTDTARKLKMDLEEVKSERELLRSQNEPLRKQISKLTDEANKVHMEAIRTADDRDAKEKGAHLLARKLQAEISDLKFVNNQYLQRLSTLQRQAEGDRRKVEEAFAKMGLVMDSETGELFPSAKGPLSAKKGTAASAEKLFQRLPKIDIETGLEPMDGFVTFKPPEPATVDIINVAQGRISSLEKACEDLKGKNTDLENELQTLRDQLAKREQEIVRLGTQLEVARAQQFASVHIRGRPLPKLPLSAPPGTSLEDDGEIDAAESAHLLPIARERIQHLEQQVEYLLEQERADVEKEKAEFAAQLEGEKAKVEDELRRERHRNSGLLRAMARLDKMVQQYNALTGQELSLSAGGSPLGSAMSLNSPSYSHPTNPATPPNKTQVPGLAFGSRLSSPTREGKPYESKTGAQNERAKTKTKEDNHSHKETMSSAKKGKSQSLLPRAAGPQKVNVDTATQSANDLERSHKLLVEDLERQNNKLKREVDYLQLQVNSLSSSKTDLSMLFHEKDELEKVRNEVEDELSKTKTERDRLIETLAKVEVHMSELQNALEDIKRDRENAYKKLTEPEMADIGILTEDIRGDDVVELIRSEEQLKKEASRLKERIKTLEDELTKASDDKRTVGRQTVEEFEVLQRDQQRLLASLEKAERDLSRLQNEINRLNQELHDSRREVDSREREANMLREELREARGSRTQEKETSESLRHRLDEAISAHQRSNEEADRLRKELYDLSNTLVAQKELVLKMDRDRDMFRVDLDVKTEKLYDAEETIKKLNEANAELKDVSAKLREQLDVSLKTLTLHEKSILNLQRQLDSVRMEKDQMRITLQDQEDDLRILKADFDSLTKEKQILTGELSELSSEKERILKDLKDCDRQINSLTDVITTKDHEREQLLMAYRKLIAEHDKLELSHNSAVEDANTLRMEIVLRDKRIVQAQSTIDEYAKELSQMKIDIAAFERQCNIAQELSSTLDRGREELQKRLGALTVENERLTKQLTTMESECEILRKQMAAEVRHYFLRITVKDEKRKRLESMINSERSQRMKLERISSEMEARNTTLETKLVAAKAGSNDGGGNAAVARKAWMQAEEEKRALAEKVEELEAALSKQATEYEEQIEEKYKSKNLE